MVKVAVRVFGINVLSLDFQVCPAHLGQRPGRRRDHSLLISICPDHMWSPPTLAASLDRSATSRPARSRTLLPALLIVKPLRLNRPIRDH